MNEKIMNALNQLFRNYFGMDPISIVPLPQGGSDRKYFRLEGQNIRAIGAFNPDIDENNAFFYLTNHFGELNFPVPNILGISNDQTAYLLNDLGDETLFKFLICTNWESEKSIKVLNLSQKTLALLARIQIEGAKSLDFSRCYPKSQFDLQSIMWDLNYFKYSFLKPSGIRFNEGNLDDDFISIANELLKEDASYFHYRDFQSRNIMIVNDEPFLIDYQGGRKGPLLYDVASFLYQAKANFPQTIREELLNFYLDQIAQYIDFDKERSKNIFPLFALFRVLQTLGAYGFRGFFERRIHFLQSIPNAVSNLGRLIDQVKDLNIELPELSKVLVSIQNKFGEGNEQTQAFDGLTIEITSFSFKKGYPKENAEHGGGYVFDCRALPNPGRLNQYKMLTGIDQPVIDYLSKHSEVEVFFERAKSLVVESVNVYKYRGFNHLSVSFGCTGGQHRSVYMANRLANSLVSIEGLRILLKHREIS